MISYVHCEVLMLLLMNILVNLYSFCMHLVAQPQKHDDEISIQLAHVCTSRG